MNVRNCKKCGRLYNYITGINLCPACREELEDKFQEVKEYIYDHPDASIQQISEDCEVEIAQIKRWIREERLTFSDNSVIGIECEVCGALIKTGRFCDRCKSDIAKGLIDATRIPQKEEPVTSSSKSKGKDRMRFLDKH
ncbi:flagellar protein [bacterium C-53]|nr:flagellar protein [Lachnospiraceae bacterium]NBI01648.1 flagellar protein [Lachnospiraceae bacterium]RKJ12942.1 flagellar protein [bacterium C-53]